MSEQNQLYNYTFWRVGAKTSSLRCGFIALRLFIFLLSFSFILSNFVLNITLNIAIVLMGKKSQLYNAKCSSNLNLKYKNYIEYLLNKWINKYNKITSIFVISFSTTFFR